MMYAACGPYMKEWKNSPSTMPTPSTKVDEPSVIAKNAYAQTAAPTAAAA